MSDFTMKGLASFSGWVTQFFEDKLELLREEVGTVRQTHWTGLLKRQEVRKHKKFCTIYKESVE